MSGNKFSDRSAGFYLWLAGGVILLIALFRYLSYGGVTEYGVQGKFIIPILAAILLVTLSIFVDQEFITILAPACAAAALGFFLVASINIITGYVFNLAMFGDVTMIGAVKQVCILTGIGTVAMVIASFMKTRKADN